MNLVADECLLAPIVARLREDGHTVHAIRDTDLGAADPDVLNVSVREHSVLVTQDKDFGELVFRLGLRHAGVVLVRLVGLPFAERAELVSEVIRDHADELPGAFTVISPSGVRIRRPGPPPSPPADTA